MKPRMEWNQLGHAPICSISSVWFAKHIDCRTISFIVSTIIYYLSVLNKVSDTVVCHVNISY